MYIRQTSSKKNFIEGEQKQHRGEYYIEEFEIGVELQI
jgi:hypothetical protein